MNKYYYKKNSYKKSIGILLVMAMMISSFLNVYARDAFTDREVEEPTAAEKNVISEGVIIHNEKIIEYNPLNPTPSDADVESLLEKATVDNYNIDLKTIGTRIKYFSPTYLYARTSAQTNVYKGLYSAGGSVSNLETIKDNQKELPTTKRQLADQEKSIKKQLTQLTNAGASNSDPRVSALNAALVQVSTGIATIDMTSVSLSSAVNGYSKVIRMAQNIDNNSSIQKVREQLTQAMSSAFLSYKQLELVTNIYEQQTTLQEKIYKTYQQNYTLGLATRTDVEQQRATFNNTKKMLLKYKTLLRNTKELIAINLGYDSRDINKLNFIEPEVDESFMLTINQEVDYPKAYYSNATYQNYMGTGSVDKRLPGSTSRVWNDRMLVATRDKIITKMDELYVNLMVAKQKYDTSNYEREILSLNKQAANRKHEQNLVSDTEYLGLQLKNLSTEMNVKAAKYNYITAMNNYYYATYGILSID